MLLISQKWCFQCFIRSVTVTQKIDLGAVVDIQLS